jgi:hypothetical protein
MDKFGANGSDFNHGFQKVINFVFIIIMLPAAVPGVAQDILVRDTHKPNLHLILPELT